MPAILGTCLVVTQMALLALEFDVRLAMSVGLVAAISWAAHALRIKDVWLLVTNVTVGGFAIWGVL